MLSAYYINYSMCVCAEAHIGYTAGQKQFDSSTVIRLFFFHSSELWMIPVMMHRNWGKTKFLPRVIKFATFLKPIYPSQSLQLPLEIPMFSKKKYQGEFCG